MSRQQATLPFSPIADLDFSHYMGNTTVVDTLSCPATLPQYTYLWGVPLTGKSHLLHALSDVCSQQNLPFFFLSAEQLQNTDITAVLPRDIQFLLIDDIDVLAGQDQHELALFNLFNHCRNHGHQLVTSSQVHPKSTIWQLPDLVSRLNSGLTLSLEPLKGPQALACIEQQFKMNGIRLEAAVIQYIESHHSSSYPALYRLFSQVAVESLKLKRKVTVPLVKQAIKNLDVQESQV